MNIDIENLTVDIVKRIEQAKELNIDIKNCDCIETIEKLIAQKLNEGMVELKNIIEDMEYLTAK